MGYSETLCQLCGVSFAIARYRRPDEPPTAAWDCTGSGFRDADGYTGTWDDDERCVGCFVVQREAEVVVGEMMGIEKMLSLEQEQLYKDWEHLAGRECKETRGYSGWRISLDEMKVCCLGSYSLLITPRSGFHTSHPNPLHIAALSIRLTPHRVAAQSNASPRRTQLGDPNQMTRTLSATATCS